MVIAEDAEGEPGAFVDRRFRCAGVDGDLEHPVEQVEGLAEGVDPVVGHGDNDDPGEGAGELCELTVLPVATVR